MTQTSSPPDPPEPSPHDAATLSHGVVGNGRVLALVKPSSAVEWLCLPRFDSPSVFGRLLDPNGGVFRILSRGREITGELRYIQNTNVLRTVFTDGDASWEVLDFSPRLPRGNELHTPIELTRIVRPLRGVPRLSVDFDPRPDYARADVRLSCHATGIEVHGGNLPLYLTTSMPLSYVLNRQEFALTRPIFFLFGAEKHPEVPPHARVQFELDETILGWRNWAKTCALPTFAPEQVLRSALCLELHVYQDTGAIIAAATTSIPEAMGTQRTWDYRYCWLRDSAFVVEALRRLGHLQEGERFIDFLRDLAEQGALQPLYGIGGERDLEERFLPHLAGFGGNGHVRIGNAASLQQQNDLNGEIILCLQTLLTDPRIVHADRRAFFPLVRRLVEEAIALAPTPDMGIWEFRTMIRHYTFSRAMCWAAVDRGAKLAHLLGEEGYAEQWSLIAERERAIVLERGYSEKLGFFTQTLDGQYPDASNLLLATIGLIDGRDPRFVSTVAAYERLLVRNGLMLRYANTDDFGDTTSAFTICSFWWAEALALGGRLDDAAALFRRLMAFANPVGLFSEDVEPSTGRLLGNFPQAYTHVGLIHAAVTISELLEAREGRVRAWM